MSIAIDVAKTVGTDLWSYFVTKNRVADNAVVASAVVASPDLVHTILQISAGVSLESSIAAGGLSMWLAIAVVAGRTALYFIDKARKPKAA